MVPLQSSSASLAPSLGFLVVFVVLGAVVGALGSAVVRRLSNPVSKYRLLYALVCLPFALVSYVALAAAGFERGIRALVAPWAPTLVASGLATFAGFLAAGLVWLAAYAPTVRGVCAVRDVDLSTRRSVAKMARFVGGVSVVLAVVVTPVRAVSAASSPLGLAALLAGVVVVFLYGSPWILPLVRTTRRPTGETADRLDALCARAGLDVRDVRILDTDDEETADSLVRGPPSYRRLFVTSTFLDRFDDDTAAALLAITAGRLRAHLLALRVVSGVVAGLGLVASFTGVGPRWSLLGVALVAVGVGTGLSRRAIRAADADAADRVGAAAVATALDRYAETHALETTHRRLPNPLSWRVALGDRIDALRADGPN